MVRSGSSARRAARMLLLTALVALPARGGWTTLSVPGTPVDVQFSGPNTFAVSTTNGVYQFENGALVGSYRIGTSIVGGRVTSGCMCSIDGTSGRLEDSCSAQTQLFGSGVLGLRQAQNAGGAYLVRSLGGNAELHYFASGVSVVTPPELLPAFATDLPVGPLDVEKSPVGTIAAIQVQGAGTSNTSVRYARESTLLGTATINATGTGRDLDLVTRPSGLHTFVAADDGLFRMDSTDGAASWGPGTRVFTPASGEDVLGVSLDGGAGLAGANGHGAMVVSGGAVDRLFRSVPVFSGQDPIGSRWVPSLAGLSSSVPFAGVECLNAVACVAWRSSSAAGNLALYSNLAPPTVTLAPLPPPVGEGASFTVSIDQLDDADGDPVGILWDVQTDVGAPPVHVASPDGRQVSIDTAGLGICEPQRALRVRTLISDGLSAHQVNSTEEIVVLRSRQPQISPASGTLLSGGAPLVLNADPADFDICAPSGWSWSVTGPGSLSQLTGQQTSLSSAGAACDPAGGTVSVTVVATGSQGPATSPAAVFDVPAWGPSPSPFVGTAPVLQAAGTQHRYVAQAHACASASGFPGQETRWRLTSPALDDVRFVDDQGQLVGTQARGAGLTVVAGNCAVGAIEFEVQSALTSGAFAATPSTLRLRIEQPHIALADATLAAESVTVTAGLLSGTLSTNIPCPSAEGWLASVQLSQEGLPVGPAVTVTPDGPFELPLPELCSGGSFTMVATLLDPSGSPGAQVTVPVSAERAPAAVGELVEPNLLAGCAQGARGTLSLEPVPGSCLGATWTWTRTDGPALVEDVLHGATVELASAPGIPLEELVGRTLTFEVRAEAGGGNVDVREVVVPIGAEVLVDVEASTELPLVPADGYSGARFAVRNRTACALRTLQLRAPLSGFSVAPGPILVDGQASDLSVDGDALSVDALALSAHGGTELELMLRPSLSGRSPTLTAEVLLNSVRISAATPGHPPSEPATGCGCAGGATAQSGALLGLLAVLLRRRTGR